LVLLESSRGVLPRKQQIGAQFMRWKEHPGRRRVLVHRVLKLGRGAGELRGPRAVPLDVREDRGRPEALHLHLVCPVLVLRCGKRVPEALQVRDLRPRRGEVAPCAAPSARAKLVIAAAQGKRSHGKFAVVRVGAAAAAQSRRSSA